MAEDEHVDVDVEVDVDVDDGGDLASVPRTLNGNIQYGADAPDDGESDASAMLHDRDDAVATPPIDPDASDASDAANIDVAGSGAQPLEVAAAPAALEAAEVAETPEASAPVLVDDDAVARPEEHVPDDAPALDASAPPDSEPGSESDSAAAGDLASGDAAASARSDSEPGSESEAAADLASGDAAASAPSDSEPGSEPAAAADLASGDAAASARSHSERGSERGSEPDSVADSARGDAAASAPSDSEPGSEPEAAADSARGDAAATALQLPVADDVDGDEAVHDAAIDADDLEEVDESQVESEQEPSGPLIAPIAASSGAPVGPPKLPPLRSSAPPPPPGPRPVVVVPPLPPTASMRVPPVVPRIPTTRASAPGIQVPSVSIPPVAPRDPEPRTHPPTRPPAPTAARPSPSQVAGESMDLPVSSTAELSAGGIETGTATPQIVVEQPLEAHLETPTVIDRALADLGDAGSEKRADALAHELETTADAAAAAFIAYELGELCERRLADEARAVKAFGRALALDPSLRPNLWAIRRVFYRRALWPNLVKLIDAEVAYARDDYERADLLLEKARVIARMGEDADAGEARQALEEATRIAPQHQGALLELERVVARAGDVAALLEVWDLLVEAVEQPARKISYLLEIGRTAASADYERARSAFERAATLAAGDRTTAERVAREHVRITEEHGTPEDASAAIDALASVLLQAFGPAGPADGGVDAPERATAIRRELLALRRRQAQLARAGEGGSERAWDVLQQAHAMAPSDPVILDDLTELAEELGRYEDLAELVQSWQAVEGDEGRAMALSIRRADALLRGGKREQARALLTSLEAGAPGFIVLTSAAERDALARGDLGDLARTYVAAGHAAMLGTWLGPGQPPAPDPGAAAALFVQAAEILAYDVASAEGADVAAVLDEARTALGKALEAVPTYAPAHEALVELDNATGNTVEGLARLRTAALTANADDARAAFERGIRFARAHGDLDGVAELERALVERAPDELGLRWRLEATLAQLGRDDERAELLVEIAATETDATRRGTALLAAARLRERGGAVEAATELYRQVLAVWPEDTFARESLVDLLRAQERWAELVAERRAEAAALPDGDAARRALREAAWVLEVRLDDAATAAQVYEDWLARTPDDRTALAGVARCRALAGDHVGEAGARRTLVELAATAENQWLFARALERTGQLDEATDAYRALAAREEASVAAATATLALAELAAGRGDTTLRVEATAALAARTTDPRLAAALAEDSGWMYALVLEDFDRGAEAFAAAIELEPTRQGALLGAALVAARRGDQAGVSAAYDGLADAVDMPEARAALHLRAAALAAASGDVELANQRVAAARAQAPDDVSALLVSAETKPTPFVDDDAGDAAIDPLLARAEVLEMRGALADDPVARASWELDRAEALELAGRLREAGAVVVAVLKAHPGNVRALEAMRRMAQRAHDHATWAQASYELARVLGDPSAKLALLRDAASVLDVRGEAPTEQAVAIHRRILQVDPGAPELERYLELLRERADVHGLVRALTERLGWLEAEHQDVARDQEMVPLLLERATVLHGLGDQPAAMADLDAILDRAATHVEALRFRADLAFDTGDVDHAVALWRRCALAETRPQRRQEIELRLAKVLAENVNDLAGAIENLERVVEGSTGSGDEVALRERLLGLCLRANDWERATRELRALTRLRPTPQDKAREELRLGLMLRDRLGDRVGARLALDRARSFDPLNLDVVRELSEIVDPPTRTSVLAATVGSLRTSIVQNPRNPALYDRLAQVTAWQSDVDARWLALVGFEALGTPTVDQRQVLEQGRARLGIPGRIRLDEPTRAVIRGGVNPFMRELWRAIAPAVQVATGVDPGKLGFARGDRLALKKLGERYEPLANTLAAFGVENVELYVSASRGGIARSLAAETPILCIGADVAAAKTAQQRWLLGRSVANLAEGLSTLADLRDVELGWTFAAALRAADAAIPPGIAEAVVGEDASIVERAKLLKKELSRKAKATVQQLVQQRGSDLVDVPGFRRDALAVGSRAGLLWSGDLAVALAQLDVGKGGKALTDSPAALELTAWSVSMAHCQLRERIGVALKGMR